MYDVLIQEALKGHVISILYIKSIELMRSKHVFNYI